MNKKEEKKARRKKRQARKVEVFIPNSQRPSWDIRSVGMAHGKSFKIPSFVGEAKREGFLSEQAHKMACQVLMNHQMGQKKFYPTGSLRPLVDMGMLRESKDGHFYLVYDTREWDLVDQEPESPFDMPFAGGGYEPKENNI